MFQNVFCLNSEKETQHQYIRVRFVSEENNESLIEGISCNYFKTDDDILCNKSMFKH